MKYLLLLMTILITSLTYGAEVELKAQVVNGKAYVGDNTPQEAYGQVIQLLKDKPDGLYSFQFDGQQVRLLDDNGNTSPQSAGNAQDQQVEPSAPVETPPAPASAWASSAPAGPQWEVRDWVVIIDKVKFKPKDYNINVLNALGKKKYKLVYSKKHYRMPSGKISEYDKTLLTIREIWMGRIRNILP